MTPAIVEVTTRRQLRDFIDFPEKLYADSPYWVPDLRGGEFKALGPDNPALEFSERILYLAYDGDRIVGRIAGIVNYKANEKWDTRTVRFGWMDFIEDFSVAEALIDAVKNWGAFLGMNRMSGPMGFNNLDKAGLLVDGFEYLSPFTCIYNYPYYRDYLERLGFVKEADWTQTVQQITGPFPERILKLTSFLEQRYGFHFYAPKTRKQMRTIGREMFHLYNEAFVNVHGATPLNEKQIDYSLSSYISIMNSKYTCFVMDRENKIAGFAISVPSLSKAIRKAKGRLFPFGFVHILRALHHNDTLEALLIGILPKYQGMGINAMLMSYIYKNLTENGISKVLANPRFEDNSRAQRFFADCYKETVYARRRCYTKDI